MSLRIAALILAFSASASAETLRLPSIFGDHMVLPTGPRSVVFGWDQPGTTVTVQVAGKQAKAIANEQGRWQAHLKGLKPGGPYELSVQGSQTRLVQDVLLGEVWLASGQSNMEFQLRLSEGAEKAVQAAGLPQLRLFTVDRVAALSPAQDLPGRWTLSTPETAGSFSAVAWHFGSRRQQAQKIPVGLINASWGGTAAEAWMPRVDLEGLPFLESLLARWDADSQSRDLWSQGQAYEMELRGLSVVDAQGKALPLPHTASAEAWTHSEKPGSIGQVETATAGIRYSGRLLGGAWGSAAVPLRSDLSAASALRFEARGQGRFIPSFSQPSIKDYDYYAGSAIQLGSDWATYEVNLGALKQGGWGLPVPLERASLERLQFAPQVSFWPELGAAAYNGMIAPLQPYGIRGVLWYQGESNAGRAKDYAALLQALVGAWRRDFEDPKLAVAVVQLPEYQGGADWAALQQAQADAVAGLEQAVLVPALGLGDPMDIHPRRKAELGERLFRSISKAFPPR